VEGNRYHRCLHAGEVAGEERTRRGENSRIKWQAVCMLESESHGAAMGVSWRTMTMARSHLQRPISCAASLSRVMRRQFRTGCDLHRVTVCLLRNSSVLLVFILFGPRTWGASPRDSPYRCSVCHVHCAMGLLYSIKIHQKQQCIEVR